jgi:hypothetical protein
MVKCAQLNPFKLFKLVQQTIIASKIQELEHQSHFSV